MKAMIKLTIVLAFLPLTVKSQNGYDGLLISPNFGEYIITGTGLNTHIALGANIDIYARKNIISFEYLYHDADDEMQLYNAMYGRYFGDVKCLLPYMQIGGGIVKKFIAYEDDELFPGIVLKTGVKILPSKYIGLGIDLQANLNQKYSSLTWMISLDIGYINVTK